MNEMAERKAWQIWSLLVVLTLFYKAIDGQILNINVNEDAQVRSTLSSSLPSPGIGFHYSLFQSGDLIALSLFDITRTGQITVKKKLKYQVGKRNTYDLVALKRKDGATMGGIPNVVRINIVDVNDHSPVFKKQSYQGHISEGLGPGSSVLGLEDCFATDEDSSGISRYIITEGNSQNLFRPKIKDISGLKLLVLETTGTLDREGRKTTPFIDLKVKAIDGGNTALQSDPVSIRIKILDKNDHSPVFDQPNWRATIQENSPVMTSVRNVRATDKDEGSNSQIYYYFKDLQDDFLIDPYTGVIYVAAPLDSKRKSSYDITVVASDRSIENPRTSTSSVLITVVDVAGYPTSSKTNQPPEFQIKKYDIKIRGDLPINAFVLLPKATDPDGTGSINGRLTYTLEAFGQNPFTYNQKSGVISVKSKLPISSAVLNFRMTVRDGLGSSASVPIAISIRDINTNQNSPVFNPSTVNVNVKQDASKTTQVFKAMATDKDGLEYLIVGGSGLGRFAIDSATGVVTPKVTFKSPRVYDLYIQARDKNKFKLTSTMYARINIKLSDVARPVFSKAMYVANVEEEEPAGTFVTAVFVENPDPTKPIKYTIIKGGNSGLALDSATGVVTTTQKLNYEIVQKKYLEISAEVVGTTLTSKTVVDVNIKNINDEIPVFPRSNINLKIPENLGYIPNLVCLFATDGDGTDINKLTYTITEGNTGNVFSIDKETGQLSVKNLDYQKVKQYELKVEAFDGYTGADIDRRHVAKATVKVIVEEDTTTPKASSFASYNNVANIQENSPAGTTVKDLEVLRNPGSFTCDFGFDATPTVLSHFRVETRTSSCFVRTAVTLKWSKELPSYKFTIRAISKANSMQYTTAELNVVVLDQNDHAPEFEQGSYARSVPVSTAIGASVLTISAIDKDEGSFGAINYDLVVNADSNRFNIDSKSGSVTVRDNLMSGKEYRLTVRATDKGTRSKDVQVTVSVHPSNVQLPQFVNSIDTATISEDRLSGTVIDARATVSSGIIEYAIVGGNEGNVFSIDTNGLVSLNQKLDYETKKEYKLVVRATKQGTTPKLVAEKVFKIKVADVNDNTPEFNVIGSSIDVKIVKNSPIGTVVNMFKAFDKDSGNNGKLIYNVINQAGSPSIPFTADRESGIVSTTGKIDSLTTYNFKLQATDEGAVPRSADLQIKVTVVDGTEPPSFTDTRFRGTIDDNSPVGRSVGDVSVKNDQATDFLRYEIISGNEDKSFCIDFTKTLHVQKQLDRDVTQKDQYKMTVIMRFKNHVSSAVFWVIVRDNNDNAPVFASGYDTITKSIPESSAKGTAIYKVKATDRDKDLKGSVEYSLFQVANKYSEDKFGVNAVTGEVTLKNLLDYEQLDKHVITIKASDKATPPLFALKKLVVDVTDVNDEAPVFSNPRYEAKIRKDAKSGEQVLRVYASDLDSGKNGEVFYELIKDKFGLFKIDPATGMITLREIVAMVSGDSFEFAAVAKDKGVPEKSGQANVIVRTFTSDGEPKFALPAFKFDVPENKQMRGTATAISVDPLTYSIVSGNIGNRFQIDKDTGLITSIQPLDAEQGMKYELIVKAKDTSERSSTAKVTINVKNSNDNEPVFKEAINGLIEKVITNKVVPGEKLLTVKATDADVGDVLTYEITDAAQKENFKIGSNDGVITLKKALTTLNAGKNYVEFNVRATDRGTPKKSKSVKVRVVFANFRPNDAKIMKSVSEASPVSTTPIIINLPRIYPQGSYQIVYPKVHPFVIDAKTGQIRLAAKLDYETVKSYDIVIQENNDVDKTQYTNYRLGISVQDANDNAPQLVMPNLKAEVNRNARPGTQVIKLVATDKDSGPAGQVSFEIVSQNVPFTINPVTNHIEVAGINAIKLDTYSVDIRALDNGVPQKSSDNVKIIVNVVNKPPLFEKNLYKFSVPENANVDKVVGTIKARSLSGIAVAYSITTPDANGKFRVDNNGNVILQKPLDYETDPSSFSLIVTAKEISGASLSSTTNVIVQIEDINDNSPRFTQVEFISPDIREDSPINTLLLRVTATDGDCGNNGKCMPGFLTYTTDQFTDTFKLDPITGEIRNIRPLDSDVKKIYKFNVKVEDSGSPKRSAIAGVVIKLKHVNDNPPVFTPNSETLYISERISKGVVITVVKAKDIDNDPITYAFDSGNENGHFAIDPNTGKVTVQKPEFFSFKFTLKISAFDGKHKGQFTLNINIDDKNDKTPKFKNCLNYRPNVDENSPVGTLVIQVKATDDDEGRNGMIEYSLLQISSKGGGQEAGAAPENVGSSITKDFIIDKKNGRIYTNKKFDREAQSTYTVLAIARDGGPGRTDAERNSAACQLTIVINDKNDMEPIFAIENYEVSIWDQTAVDTVILQTSAIDLDIGTNAKIVYSMFGDSALFKIPDQNSGKVAVKASLLNKIGTYNFRVQAANPGTTFKSTVQVKVTVGNSKPPKFTQEIYTTSIKESRTGGYLITSLSIQARSQSNLPNAKIVYSAPKGNLIETNKETFTINSETGVLKVAGGLNYESYKKYIVYVQAKDESNNMVSNAIVYVNIEDVNDNVPLFHLPKYEYVTVTEGQGSGVVVGQVYASDRDSTTNAELKYSIISASDAFTIDANTGKLTTKRTFDREKKGEDEITIHVSATDKGIPPQDSNVYVSVKIIDINDNPPVFVQQTYNGQVKEDVPVNHKVLKIQATDKDAGENAKVQFYITGGNEKGYFSTSKSVFEKGTSTAWIIVDKKLDRETNSQFSLKITATDAKFSVDATANIQVLDANDNAPVFRQAIYTGRIKEGSKVGVRVTQVTATDKDTPAVQKPIEYSLGKDAEGMFVIDKTTGVITTGNKAFDREKKDEYRFTVIASDGKLQGTALVKCTIEDVNDEAPYFPGAPFTRYVKEEQPPDTIVGYVPAIDKDDPNAGGNAKIKYSIEGKNDGFKIDPDTGLVRTTRRFDREDKKHSPVYKIDVVATDGGIPVQKNKTTVTIIITDANDHDPRFIKSSYKGTIKECAPVGTSITTVVAEDNDDPKTVNAQLMYYIVGTNQEAARYFHVNAKTGVVTVKHGLDFEKSNKYSLTVGVKDRGVPQRPVLKEATAVVDIEVGDCNDNQPTFVPSSYNVSIPENTVVGNTVLTVTAVDKDKGTSGEFTFKVVDTEKNFRFGIKNSPTDSGKGIVTLLYPLDREDIPSHVFKLSASDKGIPSLTGYADVRITLIDINDNGPHFDKPDYCGKVEENKRGYQKVATIKVTDPDTLKYSCPCTFSISKGAEGLFKLANADGNSVDVVTTDSSLFDREKKQVYTLYITASDQGKPPMKNTTFVKVDVLDKNDNEPSSGGSLSLLVNSYKGKFIGGPIGKVYITDNDRGTNDIYDHALTSQTPGQFFSVNPKTGDIIAQPNVPVGTYKLNFESTEVNRNVGIHLRKKVKSSADVTVRGISEKQAKTSVAIRMTGLVKSSTCKELMYPEFEGILAELLGVDKKRVTVFSAQEVKDLHRGVDIRFAVKKAAKAGFAGDDNEYIDPTKLIPLLNAKKAELEKKTGGKVASIGIDACAKETCQVGFCYNDIQPQRTYSIVTDDNGIVPANPTSKTFISIDMKVIPVCLVEPRKPKSCKDKPCKYGGKCTDLITGGYTCSCSKKSVGPECQQASKSFKTKDSYLWLKPFNYFFEGTLSFDFVTKNTDGILLYQGPVSEIRSTETKDFLAIELVKGRLQISVNQGDVYRIFKQIIPTKNALNDGVYHSVEIYKRGKFIRITVDGCRDAEIVETAQSSTQDRSKCEITGTIGGPFRFINGMNPLQLGGMKKKDLKYPPLTSRDSFEGCIRNVIDNGVMYDLALAIEERDTGFDCPFFNKCPVCYHGFCRTTMFPLVCICDFGWTGALCNERVKSQHYLANSYTEYSPAKRVKRRTWHDKYTSIYMVQVRTKVDGYVVYEASSMTYGVKQEYSILEIVNKNLQYRFNVGDGAKTLTLRNVVIGDGKWHNVTLSRVGNYASLNVHGVGMVAGTVGTHRLLDTDGFIYTGGVPSKLNIKGATDMQGCIGDIRAGGKNLDKDSAYSVRRVNVEPSCPCLDFKCVHGTCVGGSPPYCICSPGYTGPHCSILITKPETGALAVMAKDSFIVIGCILAIFLIALVLAALVLAGRLRKKTVPVYVDDDPRDNIMPYHDEGAGEDDFHNYDLEKLLKHAGAARGAGLANGAAAGGTGKKDIEHEPLLAREDVSMVNAEAGVVRREKRTRFEAAANAESVDVARFITSRLAEADTEDAAYPRDTLLHYGYEGEGSDVDDLSELGESEDESDDDEADFGFLHEWGAKFDNLNKIFNPPASTEFDEDV